MNVNLTPQQEEYIQLKIAGGGYNNASEVLREAVRLLQEQDRVREEKIIWLRQAIQEGLDSGPAVPLDMEEIIRQARADLAARMATQADGSNG